MATFRFDFTVSNIDKEDAALLMSLIALLAEDALAGELAGGYAVEAGDVEEEQP